MELSITKKLNAVKALNSGHLEVLQNLSVIKRCPLSGGSLTNIVIFGNKTFVCYSSYVLYLGYPLLGNFTVKLFYALNKTPLGETGCLSNLYYLLAVQAFSFLIHLPFQTWSVRTSLVPHHSLCGACVAYKTPCYDIFHQVLPAQPVPRDAESFPRGSKYPKDVSLPKFLAYLQPV